MKTVIAALLLLVNGTLTGALAANLAAQHRPAFALAALVLSGSCIVCGMLLEEARR